MSDKMRNLVVRTLSGAVLLGVVLAAAYLGKYSYGALLFVIMVVGMAEFYRLAKATGSTPQIFVGLVTGVALFVSLFIDFACGDEPCSNKWISILQIYFLALIPTSFIIELFKVSQTPLRNIATTLMGVLYVALPMSLMLLIPVLLTGGEWKPEAFLFYLFIVWANDVCAYLVGVSIGKHRMCERISPKKSWEGFFGGVIGALGMGILGASVVDGDCGVWLGLAAVISLTGVLGDLVESMFKREAGIKDSGNILPGHGGMLDRFDALLISSPYAFVYLLLVL